MKLAESVDFHVEDWNVLLSVLPDDWEVLAHETGALKGLRKNKSAEKLLRTLLLHMGCGYSLRETVARAKVSGLADLSDVALLKRLRKAGPWLQALASKMLFDRDVQLPSTAEMQVRIFDATVIREPGKTGSQWRLHYGLRLPALECDYFELTPVQGGGNGETFHRFPISQGEYVMADRGYSSTSGIQHVDRSAAYLLVRLHIQHVQFNDSKGFPFNVLDHVKTLDRAGLVGSWSVTVCGADGEPVSGRICAVRKSETAIIQSHKRIHDRAARKQQQVRPETLEAAKYVVVFTTFPEQQFNASKVLEWYRVRWQMELVFKRFKTIAQLGHLPKHDEESSKAWLYGKLFLALTTERVIRLASDFSPWGYTLTAKS